MIVATFEASVWMYKDLDVSTFVKMTQPLPDDDILLRFQYRVRPEE